MKDKLEQSSPEIVYQNIGIHMMLETEWISNLNILSGLTLIRILASAWDIGNHKKSSLSHKQPKATKFGV